MKQDTLTIDRLRSAAAGTLLASLMLAVAACGGGGSGNDAQSAQIFRESIASAHTGMAYGYYVWLPPGYASSTSSYPIVYATDSEYRFNTLQFAVQNFATPVILVNIDATSSARRWVDFTMPGAQAYFRFLTQELIPQIEARYRADPTRRIFSGHSLSGEFAMYALYLDTPGHRAFSSIISEDGSFWGEPTMTILDSAPEAVALEQQMHDTSLDLGVNLVLAGDTTSNGPRVNALSSYLSTRGYQRLRMRTASFSLGHVSMDGPAFADGLAFALSGAP